MFYVTELNGLYIGPNQDAFMGYVQMAYFKAGTTRSKPSVSKIYLKVAICTSVVYLALLSQGVSEVWVRIYRVMSEYPQDGV